MWESLFQRALTLIDAAAVAGGSIGTWSFGGGTVLMRRHHHRLSKDIDIFIVDPQVLGYLSPRLSEAALTLTADYLETASSLKLRFAGGEIDFIASQPLTEKPFVQEQLFGRVVNVEASSEIIAKKLWHRGDLFTARDIFDLAMVAEKEPEALMEIKRILRDRRAMVFARIESSDVALREAFAALDVLDYDRTYDECVERVRRALS